METFSNLSANIIDITSGFLLALAIHVPLVSNAIFGFSIPQQTEFESRYVKHDVSVPDMAPEVQQSALPEYEWKPLTGTEFKSSSADTRTWKVFSNSEYHFSFKYPSDWKIEYSAALKNPNDTSPSLHVILGNSTSKFDIKAEGRGKIDGTTSDMAVLKGAAQDHSPYRTISRVPAVQSDCGTGLSCTRLNFQKGYTFFSIDVSNVSERVLDVLFDSFAASDLPVGQDGNQTVMYTPDGRTLYYKTVTFDEAVDLIRACKVKNGMEAFAGTTLTLTDGTRVSVRGGGGFEAFRNAASSSKEKCGFAPGIGIE